MNRMQLAQPVSSPPNAASAQSEPRAVAAAKGAVAVAAGPVVVVAASQAAAPNVCGVGIRFAETTSGEFKITQLVPDRFAMKGFTFPCPVLQVCNGQMLIILMIFYVLAVRQQLVLH
jgi:outer membrane protein W